MTIAAAVQAAARLNVDAIRLARLEDLLVTTGATYDLLVERNAPPELLQLIRHRLSEFHLKLGGAHLLAGNIDKAIDSSGLASGFHPGGLDATLLHVRALLAGNRIGDALPILVKASMVHGSDATVHALLAQVFKRIGRISEAVASFRLALALKPDDKPLKAALANALMASEDA